MIIWGHQFFCSTFLLQRFGLSWIIDTKNHLKFYIEQQCDNWMKNGPWYNTTIFSQLKGQDSEGFFKT